MFIFDFVLSIIILPLYNHSSNGKIYTAGPSVVSTYVFAGICSFMWINSLITNRKNIRDRKYIPLFAFAIVGITAGLIQLNNPEMLIITFVLIFINFLKSLLIKFLIR